MRAIQVKEYVKVNDYPVLHNPLPQLTFLLLGAARTHRHQPSEPYSHAIRIPHSHSCRRNQLLRPPTDPRQIPASAPLPWISGSEFAGVVLSTPSNNPSPAFKPGDRVFGATQGGYATQVCCTEERLRPVPSGWGFLDAAGLMVTAPTSYAALVTRAGIKKGDYVLVHAAAGGWGWLPCK